VPTKLQGKFKEQFDQVSSVLSEITGNALNDVNSFYSQFQQTSQRGDFDYIQRYQRRIVKKNEVQGQFFKYLLKARQREKQIAQLKLKALE